MTEVIDFFEEKEKIDLEKQKSEIRAIEENMKVFQDYCKMWKEKQAELAREKFLLIKSKGEII